jgi:hypothetical protein
MLSVIAIASFLAMTAAKQSSVAAVAAKIKGWTASACGLAVTKVPSLRRLIRHCETRSNPLVRPCDRERSEDGKQSTDLSLRGTKQSTRT